MLVCAKQNTAVKTAINACSLLAKQTLSDLVGKGASSLIITFKQVIKPFLVLNIYFTFFLSVVDFTFQKNNIKSNCILLLCHVRVRRSRQVFCKKGVLRNFPNSEENTCARASFLKKRLRHWCFLVNFAQFRRTLFITEHLRRLLYALHFTTSCSKQAHYLKFK